MTERYPFLQFIIDAAQVIAGAFALIIFFGGTFRACHFGGFHGLLSFVVTLALAAVAYVVVMVKVEILRVLLDIESNTRGSNQPASIDPGAKGTV